MNYITNYYKNLSEKLQAEVNFMQKEVNMINEAITAGKMAPNSQSFAQAGRPQATNPGYDPQMLSALMAAYGQSSPQFDYNRDGVVDGADLGILLGGQGGTNPLTQRSTQYGMGLGNQGNQFAGPATRPPQGGGGFGGGMRPTGSMGGANGFQTQRPTQGGGGFGGGMRPTGSMGGANGFQSQRPTQGGGGFGGGSPFTGDLNGDGVVDGADLGLALGGQGGGNYQGVLQNFGMQTSANQFIPPTTQRRPRRKVR
jgi:hypothetical protein